MSVIKEWIKVIINNFFRNFGIAMVGFNFSFEELFTGDIENLLFNLI
jgi:hypothetical protein